MRMTLSSATGIIYIKYEKHVFAFSVLRDNVNILLLLLCSLSSAPADSVSVVCIVVPVKNLVPVCIFVPLGVNFCL